LFNPPSPLIDDVSYAYMAPGRGQSTRFGDRPADYFVKSRDLRLDKRVAAPSWEHMHLNGLGRAMCPAGGEPSEQHKQP